MAIRAASPGAFGPFATALSSFRDAHFRTYWANNALFFVGQGLVQIGAQWLMLTLTDSRGALGALGAIQGLTMVTLTPLGGVLCDRVNRRDLLIFIRVTFALLMGVMAALVATGRVEVWHLFISVGLSGMLMAFSQAATQTYVYDIVGKERLINAIALNSLATGAFQAIAPSAGGAIVASIGAQGTYIAGGAGYFLGAILLTRIPIKGAPVQARAAGSVFISTVRDIREGVRYIKRDRLLPWYFYVVFCGFFGSGIFVMRPVFAKDVLEVGATGLGWLSAMWGFGVLFGSIAVAAFGARIKYYAAVVVLMQLGFGIFEMGYSQSRWYSLTLGLEFTMGIFSALWVTSGLTFIQSVVPGEFRNRVLSVQFALQGLSNVNWYFTGKLADTTSDRTALFVMAAIVVFMLLPLALLNRRLMTLGSPKNPMILAPAGRGAAEAG